MKKMVFLTSMLAAGSATVMVAASGPPRDNASARAAAPGHLSPVLLSGKVVRVAGNYLLMDENTGTTFELRGADLKKYVDKTVKIQGKVIDRDPTAAGATRVFEVAQIMRGSAAGAGMGGRAAAAGVKTGLSKAAVGAIVGGTAAAGTVGGLYSSGAIGSDETPVSRP